ncbi:hypothetical protein BCR36DRAFT_367211 [Piromyces finnis]|uniref:Uncharacterized protein n=1 Tax=Piromyces finnis TaxID=1754191 RepID=A0A1Y1VIC0_9FUNG|nr:hypothetical protein BCR36DRAFT_367211 [Piromyces finnis]|eukprot:ORX57144.1 hypothetical protein BCR36DRAFT_367211 [Piromyces finnis]
MNSFKLFNRTNKNDIISNNLNGIEHKEKDHQKPNQKTIVDKKNKSNTSTLSHLKVVKSTTNNEENKNNGDNELNESNEDNKENVVVGVDSSLLKDIQHHQKVIKENQYELSKKEKSKKVKKEKRKNKKYKKSKSEQRDFAIKSNIMEGFLHHSSSLSKKDAMTGKYTGKQPVRKFQDAPKNDVSSTNLIRSYNEASQFQHDNFDIKEKQGFIGYTSDHTSDTIHEKSKFNLVIDRSERKESRRPSDINSEATTFSLENNAVVEKYNESNCGNTPSSSSFTTPKEISKENQFKFNFDNDSILNFSFPTCLGMVTPSSPAFSCITPINGSESYNNSLGDEEVDRLLYTNGNKPTAMTQQNITEKDQSSFEPITEVRSYTPSMNFISKGNPVVDSEFFKEESHKKGKDKAKQKMLKHSKKKDKKNNASLSVNTTKVDQEIIVSNSSSSLSPSTKINHNLVSPNSVSTETKKKTWNSFKKLFGKKNGRKSYYRNSLSSSIDDSIHHAYSTCNSGSGYDWDELRRRMEMEENNTVCTEDLSAREFAEVVGIHIISISDEEDDLRLDAESEYSLGTGRTTHSYYGHTHRSTKSSGPPLDMSIFIPPTEEERKNNFSKRESMFNNYNTTSSFASSTTQDYLDRLGSDLKRKTCQDSQSVSHRELNILNGPGRLQKVSDNESLTFSLHHIQEFPDEDAIEDTRFTPSEINKTSTPINKPLNPKILWSNTNDKTKSDSITALPDNSTNTVEKKDNTESSLSTSQREINLKGGISHQSRKSFCSFELKNKTPTENPKSDVSIQSHPHPFEENQSKLPSKELSLKSDGGLSNLGRRSPSISSVRSYKTYSPMIKSIKSEDSMVQEFQKGRFTVTKPIYPSNNGHRVFIVTKGEEDENGESITTMSSISSSPSKVAMRKRSCSQPASASYLTSELDKKVTSSLLKFSSSIPKNDNENELYKQKDPGIKPKKSNSLIIAHTPLSSDFLNKEHHRSATTSAADYKRRKSNNSLDPDYLNTNYNSSVKDDIEDSEDNYEQFTLSKIDSKLEKGKNVPSSLYSHDINKSFSSLHSVSTSSITPSPSVSPYSRPHKTKSSNSRFQVIYTPGAMSPSNNSICSKKSMESSKINLNRLSTRLLNNDTSSVDEPKNYHDMVEHEVEINDFANRSSSLFNNYMEENRLGRPASNHSLTSSNITTSANVNVSTSNYLQQPISNVNQHTIGSISSVLTENGIHSNASSPALSSVKPSSYHNSVKPLSIITTNSTVDMSTNDAAHHSDVQDVPNLPVSSHENNSSILQEKTNPLESTSYSTPSPHKILETNSDYFKFFKYNNSYNSIILSCCSKDNEKSEKETDNILDDMDKTEDNEVLSETEKTNDLSESSPSTPYYHHLSTPMEKPPVIPNSPFSFSYKSNSSLNSNVLEDNTSSKFPMKDNDASNESFTIFDRDLNLTGDGSFTEGHSGSGSITKENNKNSSLITASTTTPILKSSQVVSKNTSRLSMRSNLGHYRSPSTSSSNTNNSTSRFTVTRESNDPHSPNYSISKVTTKRQSNLHNSISNDASSIVNNTTSVTTSMTPSITAPSSKLKPSVVVIKRPDDKSKVISSNVTTSTESKNIGRFTVTRETIISN